MQSRTKPRSSLEGYLLLLSVTIPRFDGARRRRYHAVEFGKYFQTTRSHDRNIDKGTSPVAVALRSCARYNLRRPSHIRGVHFSRCHHRRCRHRRRRQLPVRARPSAINSRPYVFRLSGEVGAIKYGHPRPPLLPSSSEFRPAVKGRCNFSNMLKLTADASSLLIYVRAVKSA